MLVVDEVSTPQGLPGSPEQPDGTTASALANRYAIMTQMDEGTRCAARLLQVKQQGQRHVASRSGLGLFFGLNGLTWIALGHACRRAVVFVARDNLHTCGMAWHVWVAWDEHGREAANAGRADRAKGLHAVLD